MKVSEGAMRTKLDIYFLAAFPDASTMEVN
jgi:hypothetical protein